MTRLISLILCSVFLGSLPADAHHSLSIYDRGQSKTVEGVVKEFRFANPHARILLIVASADGTTKEWDFEGGGVRRLTERGISVNTIAKGDRITVSYNPMRDGSARGLFVGFTTPDGKTYVTRR
jgi:phenylpropionate dioxygenase-like ring-hydroxylating dioxygenase large terminal subunit